MCAVEQTYKEKSKKNFNLSSIFIIKVKQIIFLFQMTSNNRLKMHVVQTELVVTLNTSLFFLI